jgi:hypothetical protein
LPPPTSGRGPRLWNPRHASSSTTLSRPSTNAADGQALSSLPTPGPSCSRSQSPARSSRTCPTQGFLYRYFKNLGGH